MTDFAETFRTDTPANSDNPREAATRMREIKASLQERLDVDHYWESTANVCDDAETGKHRKVTWYGVLADDPNLGAGEIAVYMKTANARPELFVADGDGHVKQLTVGGVLKLANEDVALITEFALAVNFVLGFTVGQNTDIGNYNLRAKTLESDVPTGTAPLTVASTTVVPNLNADKCDGYEPGGHLGAVAVLDSGGNVIVLNSIYRAPVDGQMSVYISYAGNGEIVTGVIGTGNPPTTSIAIWKSPAAASVGGFSFHVAKNEYLRVTGFAPSVNVAIYWRPFTTGALVKQA